MKVTVYDTNSNLSFSVSLTVAVTTKNKLISKVGKIEDFHNQICDSCF